MQPFTGQPLAEEQALPESEWQEAVNARAGEQALFTEKPAEQTAGTFAPRPVDRSRRLRATGVIAVVLVAAILLGSLAVLFAGRLHVPGATQLVSPSATARFAGTPVPDITLTTQWAGLEMSMKVTAGPYFLGEMLSVDLSLTNHTHPKLTLAGSLYTAFPCSSPSLLPEQTGGTAPHYALYTEPRPFVYHCPADGAGPESHPGLAPGQTVSASVPTLLTNSGAVTLTGAAFFYGSGNYADWQTRTGLLTGHLPVMHLLIATRVPADRVILLQRENSKAVVHAPTGVQLLAVTYMLCHSSAQNIDQPVGNDDWQPLASPTLERPNCPDTSWWSNGQKVTVKWTIIVWDYAIAAPGYAVAQG
ncbi:MAG TPA: hypothetical protein VGD98_05955 [Ktedonobacteraceae bacterium]